MKDFKSDQDPCFDFGYSLVQTTLAFPIMLLLLPLSCRSSQFSMHSETFKLITCIFLCTGQTLIGHFYHVLGLKKDPN